MKHDYHTQLTIAKNHKFKFILKAYINSDTEYYDPEYDCMVGIPCRSRIENADSENYLNQVVDSYFNMLDTLSEMVISLNLINNLAETTKLCGELSSSTLMYLIKSWVSNVNICYFTSKRLIESVFMIYEGEKNTEKDYDSIREEINKDYTLKRINRLFRSTLNPTAINNKQTVNEVWNDIVQLGRLDSRSVNDMIEIEKKYNANLYKQAIDYEIDMGVMKNNLHESLSFWSIFPIKYSIELFDYLAPIFCQRMDALIESDLTF